jgi:hypothetical protein
MPLNFTIDTPMFRQRERERERERQIEREREKGKSKLKCKLRSYKTFIIQATGWVFTIHFLRGLRKGPIS